MSEAPARSLTDLDDSRRFSSQTRKGQLLLRAILNGLLTRRATTFWWIGLSALICVALLLHGLAWIAFPTVATADTNMYCAAMHSIEAGQYPDLRQRHFGYPLFMLACKLLPGSLNKTLPLIQHILELTAAIVITVWMRRNWGVLAGLMTGALLLASSYRAIWSHYGHPNALLCGIVPLLLILMMGALALGHKWRWIAAAVLLAVVCTTRDEVTLMAVAAPFALICFLRTMRRQSLKWLATIAAVVAIAVTARIWINHQHCGRPVYSTHSAYVFGWRVMDQEELVAPPRPAKLDALYAAAAANGAKLLGNHYHYDDLVTAAKDQMGMSRDQAIAHIKLIAMDCLSRRPGAYADKAAGDILRFWVAPDPSLEWAAFQQSVPEKFHRDAAKLDWATDAHAEFPISYEPSSYQRLFHTLAVIRPGESFAIKPLLACFVIGCICLLTGIGCKGRRFRRWWFTGLAGGVVGLTLLYALVVIVFRYRMSMEWAFFAVASLGIVLPLRGIRQRLHWGETSRGKASRGKTGNAKEGFLMGGAS